MGAALPGNDEIFPAVSIEVMNPDLEPGAGAFACGGPGDEVFGPSAGPRKPVIGLKGDVVVRTGVPTGVGVVAFACDELRLAVAIDIIPGQRMSLGKLFVDEMLTPGGGAVGLGGELFVPVEPVAVPIAPDEVVATIAIEIDDENGATGVREVEVVVTFPWSRVRAGGGLFIPTMLVDQVLSAVTVEVAESEPVPVALAAACCDHVLLGGDLSAGAADEAEDLHGIALVV